MLRAARLLLLVGGWSAASLLPSTALPESHVAAAATGSAPAATARLTFKIIVPQVLSVQVGSVGERALAADTVAVRSNGHDVTLNAAPLRLDSSAAGRFNLILNGAARKGVAQDARCSPAPRTARQVVCTVSMP